MQACIIYVHLIIDPLSQDPEVSSAVTNILEIVKDLPRGYGLEMGHYWALFMAGVALFNNYEEEELIRQILSSADSCSLYVCHIPTTKCFKLTNS